jgi:hypothetical protein
MTSHPGLPDPLRRQGDATRDSDRITEVIVTEIVRTGKR